VSGEEAEVVTSATASSAVDVNRLDQVRVIASLRRIAHTDPADAFVVSIDIAPWQAFEERSVLELLARVPIEMGRQTFWSLQVARTHEGVGPEPSEARADIRLDLVVPTADATAGLDRLTSLTEALCALVPRSTRRVTREEAIEQARDLVALVWSIPYGSPLAISDEEHHTAPHRWTLGLVGPDLTRFHVDIGVVAGDPHTARLRRLVAAEVSDSVGTEG
jgi:hypothetical protein